MKAVGYVRVSTEDQSREGVSLEVQRTKIAGYCDLEEISLVDIIEDAGVSAKDIKGRPGFQQALDMVLTGKADALIVWKLDRAFRSTQDALRITDLLNSKGRALVSITEKLDTTSAIGEFFFTLMASLAQMERRLIGERTSAAMQGLKQKDRRVSRYPPLGYRHTDDGRVVVNQKERSAIEKARRLRDQGYSFQKISMILAKDGVTRNGRPISHTTWRKYLTEEDPNSITT